MGVKVRERNGAWWLFIDHHGKRKAKRVGVGKNGKRSAEHAAIQIQAKLAEGDSSVLDPKTVAGAASTTFATLASISTVREKTNIAGLGRRNHAKPRRSDFPPNQGIGVG